MRKISANYIFPVNSSPLKNGIIEIDNAGTIKNIIDTKGNLKEIAGLEYYNGILVPGFINTHCHIELSYLKEEIEKQQGLTGFVTQLADIKNTFSEDLITNSIKKADKLMQYEGIKAVGDISNSSVSFFAKLKSKIHYHTFIEIYNIDTEKASETFKQGNDLVLKAIKQGLKASVSPHAPYSVSKKLFELLKNYFKSNSEIISIHNQESNAENLLFKEGKGKLADLLHEIHKSYKIIAKNNSSLIAVLPYLNPDTNILLTHNTYTSEKDIEFAEKYSENIFYTICPKSNLFIENKLPKIDLFLEKGLKITIGTDSLASNNTLSVLEELKTISSYFPQIELFNLIEWATINGAKALNIDKLLGSFEVGKTPGLNLIENIDFKSFRLKKNSKIKVIA